MKKDSLSVFDYRQNLIDSARKKGITLNGTPAKICGVRNNFASVVTIDSSGSAFQWSWGAVERIINNGGNFQS